MKKSKIIFLSVLGLFATSLVQAQKGETKLDISYNVAVPAGSFKSLVPSTSYRGFQGSVLYGVSDKLSVGFGTGFQDFYQKNSRQTYKFSDGSDVSAVLTYSIQTIPVLAQAKYSFTPGAAVQPYAALGVGGNVIAYNQLLGEFGGQQTKFSFAARPEAGLFVPFKKGGESGFTLGASYNVMPFNQDDFKNLNNLGVHAGISVPLRK
ncbi:outer membrane beta-barrel protein [Flavisolibacter ginsenosidimutans]|uniref:Porin family protein n=1 Tax=Flavisolibacter ginsenosidimutans TaxID=661481 RepID=A0A5B8UPF2_9BACT|nr:outer membrane beta-barrel protein [Flavisolibacter ginsenosidimutans]QEC57835.1 porin family protein [Flavisolibacter ginsenosidimutans]